MGQRKLLKIYLNEFPCPFKFEFYQTRSQSGRKKVLMISLLGRLRLDKKIVNKNLKLPYRSQSSSSDDEHSSEHHHNLHVHSEF